MNDHLFNVFERVYSVQNDGDETRRKFITNLKNNQNKFESLKPYEESRFLNVKNIYKVVFSEEPSLVEGIYRKFMWDFDLLDYDMEGYY